MYDRMIVLQIYRSEIDDFGLADNSIRPRDVSFSEILSLNHKHAHIKKARYSLDTDTFELLLVHDEFPTRPQGARIQAFDTAMARRRFPYLFTDTNPLLYRRF